MIALSTACRSGNATDGRRLTAALAAFDIEGLELDYRIGAPLLAALQAPLKRSRLQVVSLHNYCPIPSPWARSGGGGDLFSLSSPDRDIRREAVKWTRQSIETANRFQARRVVLHAGHVPLSDAFERLRGFFETGRITTDEAQAFVAAQRAHLDRLKGPYLDALRFSLDRLLPEAERLDVILALENRFHFFELPGLADIGPLLDDFAGGPLGYWHDTGHAHANECLGIDPPQGLLAAYGDRLVGVHVHDARGLNDHLAPGRGEIDFNVLKPYLHDRVPLVLELKPGTPDERIAAGIAHLRSLLGTREAAPPGPPERT